MPGMDGFINFNGTLEGSIAGGGGGDVTDVKVRNSQETAFESVVNEQGVAEIDLISYIRRNELTQAIENVENSIDNVEQLVDTKQNIINYSTEEQNTGIKWIDGKILYQKTFEKTINVTSANRTWYTILTSSDLRYIDAKKIFIDVSGSYIEDSDGLYNINYSSMVGSTGGIIGTVYDKETDEIQVCIAGFTAGSRTVNITIRYTKEVNHG